MEERSRVLAEVVRRFLPRYRLDHKLSRVQRRALRAILACKTPALGGHEYHCQHCGTHRHIYHGCRNRHCPQCQGLKTARWLEQQETKLLPIDYYQAVFTVASELWLLFAYNRRLLYGLLFRAASATLQEFAADARWLGGRLALIGVLHTWGQQLAFHPHLHFMVSAGGVDAAGHWVRPRLGGRFLFPVVELSAVFQRKFLRGLRRLHRRSRLEIPPGLDLEECLTQAAAKPWEVFLEPPVAGVEKLLGYLARYLHKVAISPSRIVEVNSTHVSFTYRDYRQGGVQKTMKLTGQEFLGRFLQHVVPEGFRRVRQYGLYCGGQEERLERVRQELGRARAALLVSVLEIQPHPRPESPAGPPCPQCGQPMRLGAAIAPQRLDSS